MVTIKIYPTLELAELVHQYLIEHEVHAIIEVDPIGGMQPASHFHVGVKVLVDEKDLEKAQELLQIS